MRLAWITDPHFNFLAPGATREYAARERGRQHFDAVVISGDIAEAPSLARCLNEFRSGIGVPIYFVLGNHDYYGASIAQSQTVAKSLESAYWLGRGMVELTPTTVLAGSDGFYDGRAGNGPETTVLLRDFTCVADLSPAARAGRQSLLQVVRAVAARDAVLAAAQLEQCCCYPKIIFVTHVPPFEGACWHEGNPSDPDWIPWFVNLTLGETLESFARTHPECDVTVLCGHTHSPGEYTHLPNLRVRTGSAEYSAPRLSDVLDVY